jgi:hypothetical protein
MQLRQYNRAKSAHYYRPSSSLAQANVEIGHLYSHDELGLVLVFDLKHADDCENCHST